MVERDVEVRLLLLAALSGEHLLLLGPPGTAKSKLGRRLASLVGGSFFERLLTRFTVPEEVFGPLSLQGLERDVYARNTEGYLPTASVAFLDEVFKGSSAVLNSLLTIMNERLFDNSTTRNPVPLLCLVGASNELPQSEELDALYDRFLLRKEVQQVSDTLLPELLLGDLHACGVSAAMFSPQELRSIRHAASTVQLPEAVRGLLIDVRSWAQAQGGWHISDRRMAQAANLLRVAAHAAGRRRVAMYDCLLLSHVLWQQPSQEAGLRRFLTEATHCRLLDRSDVSNQLSAAFADLCRTSCLEELPSDGVLLAKLEDLRMRLRAALLSAEEIAMRDCVEIAASPWMAPSAALAAAASLRAAVATACEKSRQQLFEVCSMLCAFRAHAPPHVVALLLPALWNRLALSAREASLLTEDCLRTAIPPCGHRIARSYCVECLAGMGLVARARAAVL